MPDHPALATLVDLARLLYREQVPVDTIAVRVGRSGAWVCNVATGRLHASLGTEPVCTPRGPTGPNAVPPPGPKRPRRALSSELVREYLDVRGTSEPGVPRAFIASELGIHPQAAYRIETGACYQDVREAWCRERREVRVE